MENSDNNENEKVIHSLFIEKQIASSRFWQYEWIVVSIVALCMVLITQFFVFCVFTITLPVSLLIIIISSFALCGKELVFQHKLMKLLYKYGDSSFSGEHKSKWD